jgi:hypothetical protein
MPINAMPANNANSTAKSKRAIRTRARCLAGSGLGPAAVWFDHAEITSPMPGSGRIGYTASGMGRPRWSGHVGSGASR